MKNILLLILGQLIVIAVQAQTNYGPSSGTQGAGYCYYGNFAGNAAQSTSYENSFFGTYSGRFTTTGFGNTAVGFVSMRNNTTGYWNTAVGAFALFQNTVGGRNTATGRMALYTNNDGSYNVANGWNALLHNTNGFSNTAIGATSLNENLTGSNNTATGRDALFDNTTGSYNTAVGFEALKDNIDGRYNTATGSGSMDQVNRGDQNCAFGYHALSGRKGSYNCAFGANTLGASVENTGTCEGDYNSAFGYRSGPTSAQMCLAMNTTALGANARITASNQIRLGDANVTSIGGQVSWTSLSDGRFKREIRKDVAGLDFINQLNPVSYTLDKKAINAFLRIPDSAQAHSARSDEPARRQVGFVAQEVEALIKKSGYVFSGIEAPQNENDPYTIRYAEFVVPLVKAVQELSGQVEELRQQLKKYEGESTVDQKNAVGAVLYQNSPNPFSTNTSIQMEIPDAYRNANVVVYNLEGKQLKNMQVNERGSVTINISGNELSAGMYLYTLMVDGKVVDTKRLVLTN